MANLNTTETENHSQIESRILQAIPLMTRENQLILVRFVEAMMNEGSSSKYSLLTAQARIQELLTITARMKSHAAILSQFFTRFSTKQAAIAGMEAELANLATLWAMVKADLSEVQQ